MNLGVEPTSLVLVAQDALPLTTLAPILLIIFTSSALEPSINKTIIKKKKNFSSHRTFQLEKYFFLQEFHSSSSTVIDEHDDGMYMIWYIERHM